MQERRAIIISTVRSSADLLAYDAKFTLGCVSNPRRFNGTHSPFSLVHTTYRLLCVVPRAHHISPTAVAVTRAQALLIVVGDTAILSVDPIWRGFMNHVYLHGGWRGDAPTWDVNAPVRTDGDYADELQEALAADMSAVMARLNIGGHSDVDGGGGLDLEGDANVDTPFQEAD